MEVDSCVDNTRYFGCNYFMEIIKIDGHSSDLTPYCRSNFRSYTDVPKENKKSITEDEYIFGEQIPIAIKLRP
jgi:hypothetical protein